MKPCRDLLIIGVGVLLFGIVQSAALAAEKPNIIFLLADDLGFKDIGFQGGWIKTPNIDKLAKNGVRLDQFYVQPVCSPTRSSLMTGRYPSRYGLQVGVVRPWSAYGLPLSERTLAQALKEAGYTTAICGKWHLGHHDRRYLPTSRGFDHQYGHYNGAIDYFTHIRDEGLDWSRDDKPLREPGYTTNLIAGESVRLIEQHDISKPLFLYVPFNAPHSPFQVPESYMEGYRHIEPPIKRKFAGMVTCMDEAIGSILAALDKRSMRENSLIFFCSDNGGMRMASEFGQIRGEKGTLYEGGVRVPAVAVWPGVLKAGEVVKAPLHIVDLYPTLIKLAGGSLSQPLALDGKDAWPVITGAGSDPHREILLNTTPFNGGIRRGDWKLVHNGKHDVHYSGEKGKDDVYELFNLANDPNEQTDLSQKEPEILKELQRRLNAYAAEAAPANIPPATIPDNFKSPKVWGHPE